MKTFAEYRLPEDPQILTTKIEEDLHTREIVLKYIRHEPGGHQVVDQWYIMKVIERDGTPLLSTDLVEEVKVLHGQYVEVEGRYQQQVAGELRQSGRSMEGIDLYNGSPESLEIQHAKIDLERRMVAYLRDSD